MARKRKRDEKPAQSNRGRPDARGVFVIFEPEQPAPPSEPAPELRAEDEPLARDEEEPG